MKRFVSLLPFATLLLAACHDSPTGRYVNAITGEACTPDRGSYIPAAKEGDPGHCQGTSNGDNCDDLHSGKIDCIGDGNSGQGDDKKHECQFPQPGCDENGCCDDDGVEDPDDPDGEDGDEDSPPDEDPPPEPDDGDDGDGDGDGDAPDDDGDAPDDDGDTDPPPPVD